MAQAKGVLPRREDREVLYASPETSAYFVGVRLASQTSDLLREGFGLVDIAVNNLVARVPAAPPRKDGKGDKVASLAVGLSARVFDLLNAGITPDQQVESPSACATKRHLLRAGSDPVHRTTPTSCSTSHRRAKRPSTSFCEPSRALLSSSPSPSIEHIHGPTRLRYSGTGMVSERVCCTDR